MQYYYDNVDPKSIGSYIRTARESRKLTQKTLFYVPEAKGIKEDDHKMILRMLKDIVKSVKKNQNKN